jgi:hypothetical protein
MPRAPRALRKPGRYAGELRGTVDFRLEPLATPRLMVSTDGAMPAWPGVVRAAGRGPTGQSPQRRSDCCVAPIPIIWPMQSTWPLSVGKGSLDFVAALATNEK